MSSSSRSTMVTKKITGEEIDNLISVLRALVPELRSKSLNRVSLAIALKELCKYIQRLHREVDSLSERLAQLLETMDNRSTEAEIIRNLLM